MSRNLKVNDLIVLAGGTNGKDDLSKYDQLPDNIKDALKRKMAARQEEASENAAEEIMQILDRSESVVEDHVSQIRNHRRRIDGLKSDLESIDEAKEYGLKTNNFLPLAARLNLIHPAEVARIRSENPELLEVKKTKASKKS